MINEKKGFFGGKSGELNFSALNKDANDIVDRLFFVYEQYSKC